jgi:sterol desaturase/sphingolipid hydroxylase (fatty acid hydroxylase superfamily)
MAQQYVSKRNETVRMFDNNVLEFFSHSHPSVPLILFLPIIAYTLYLSHWEKGLSFLATAGLFVAGLLVWTLFEYVMHRYVFHYRSKSPWAQRLHFVVHGSHHDYPNDTSRISTPPSISLPVAVVFYLLCILVLGRFGPAVFAGLALGYVCYETVHYAVHHFAMKQGVWKWLKHYHLRHHFHDDHTGYGVSSPLWDFVFGTEREVKK